jgi:hypothetical protein
MTALQLLQHAGNDALSLLGINDDSGMTGQGYTGKWDNRPTWDNVSPKFDKRPTWDNWDKRNFSKKK